MGPTWCPSGADRTQVGPMLAPWTLLSGFICLENSKFIFLFHTISLGQNDAGSSNPYSWKRRSCFSYIVSSLAADVLAKQEPGHRQPWYWWSSYGVLRNQHFKCTASGWNRVISFELCYYTPRTTKLLGGILVSLRPSVRPSVRLSVRLSRLPCPLCNIYSSGWILSILATNDHYHERVCRTQWPLTLTYIFKVIRPWLRKSCPLCSVYSSGWILFIFGTNDHYH